MKTDIHINEAKEAAAKAGKTVFNAVTSVFNVGEVKHTHRMAGILFESISFEIITNFIIIPYSSIWEVTYLFK